MADDVPPPEGADREESKEYKKALTLIKAGQLERARIHWHDYRLRGVVADGEFHHDRPAVRRCSSRGHGEVQLRAEFRPGH